MGSEVDTKDCRLRVLFFDHVATLSGGEIALANLVKHLDPNLVSSIVLLGEQGPLADRLQPYADVQILPLAGDVRNARKDGLGASSLRGKSLYASASYVYQLARFIRRNRIDIVHTNSLKADLLGGFAARLTRTPLIWHIRDRIAADYLPAKIANILRHMSGWLPDLVIANSRSTASTLSVDPSERIHVVYDGTDFDSLAAPSAVPADVGGPVIGLLGRISPWKGQDIFVRAASLVRKQYPEARFRIIGSALFNESAYEESIHALVEELDLGTAVTFAGFRHDVYAAISELDILVHASTRPEPFGQVIIEGMAAGKPVVATNAGGVPEIVEDTVSGLLVHMGDADDMARAICSLLAAPGAARDMGLRGKARVAQQFTLSRTAAGVLGVYKQLARKKKIRCALGW